MIFSKVIFAALLVVLILFLILYRGVLSLQLLIFALLFVLILRLLLWRLSENVSVQLKSSKRKVRKGESFDWLLLLRNRSSIPAVRAVAELEYRSTLAGVPQKLMVELPVRPKNTQQVRMSFHAATSGIMEMKLDSVRLYDPLRLFSVKKTLHDSAQLIVYPEPAVVPDWLPSAPETDDSPEYSKVKPGDDPSEIFDLHKYREGDAISRIHWKLSSKLDELMVKEFSLPLIGQHVLLPFYCMTSEQPAAAIRLDAMLALMSGAAELLTDAEWQTSLMMIQKMEAVPFSDMDDYYDTLTSLLRSEPLPQEEAETLIGKIFRLQETDHLRDSLLIFMPTLDIALLSQLSGLQHPEQVTVFAAVSKYEELPPDMLLPFPLVRADLDDLLPEWERAMLSDAPGKNPAPKGGEAA
ncbi:MAG: DUF58 domain-containing protein [Oscillospiraceae bacterium]|nr:DUF58 domain-containing protein [Oscillospiraceae bacterium]